MAEALPELLTPAEVATRLRCSKRHVQDLCAAGEIEATMIAGRYLMTPAAVADYVRKQTCPARTKARTFGSRAAADAGSSAGTTPGSDAPTRQARETVARLKDALRGSSSPGRRQGTSPAPVIRLSAR